MGTADQNNIVIQPNGDVTIGASYGAESMRYVYQTNVVNRVDFFGGKAGNPVGWRARGTDPNPTMYWDLQGTGTFAFSGGSFANPAFAINAFGGTTRLEIESNPVTAPTLKAALGTNVDVRIAPAGTGTLDVVVVPEVSAVFTQSHRVKVKFNGTEYWLALDAV